MTNQQIEELNELVRSWRQRHYGTGFADYDNGVDSGRDACADALDELLGSWQTQKPILADPVIIPMTNQEKAEYPYMPNQHVQFIYGDIEGSGRIRGIASNHIPPIGRVWIVELDDPIEDYSYSCIAVPGIHLSPLEAM